MEADEQQDGVAYLAGELEAPKDWICEFNALFGVAVIVGLALVIDSLAIRLADVVEKCSSAADFGGGLEVAIIGVLIILVVSNCCEGGHFVNDNEGVLPGIVAVVLGFLVVFEQRRELGQDLKNHITIYSKDFLGVWAANKFG